MNRACTSAGMLALAATLVPAAAMAWGPLAHYTIAGLADQRLSPAARQQVESLLAPDHERSLVDVATWADDLRDTDPPRFRATSRLHYVNFSSAQCNFVQSRDCRKGECVVAAIDRYSRILADRVRSRAERADALRFVVHFVADVHQPLHASFKRDKGGNTVQVSVAGEGTNLHSLWDGRLLNSSGLRWPAYVERLAHTPWHDVAATEPGHDAAQWAGESCRIVRDEGVYPEDSVIDAAYMASRLPIAERRVNQAATRLAVLLNRLLK